jgi:hypothetical protein
VGSRYIRRVTSIRARKRVHEVALAGTVKELDELAVAFAELAGVSEPPHWQIAHRDFDGLEADGSLASLAESVEMSRVRSLTLTVGTLTDPRRITLDASRWLVFADVRGDDPVWTRKAAADVEYYLSQLRPWWRFAKGAVAALVYAIIAAVLILIVLSAWGVVGVSFIFVGLFAIAVGVGSALFVIPTFRVGERPSGRSVAWRVIAWAGSLIAASLVGAYVTQWLTTLP